MKFPAYPAYRPSATEWLGNVPAHWKVLSIKRLTPVSRGASPRPIEDPKYFDDEGEYAWVRIADVTSNDHYLRETTQRLSEIGKSLSVPLEPGSLFLSIAGSVGKPMITAIKACIHDGFVYFPYLQINPEYLYYVFDSGQPYLGLGKLGTQLNLNTDTVGNIKIGLPPKSEQDAIVSFLDWKTAQIDALIAKKQALIEKLKEKRLAVITQAVTKGLDPSVPLQDSGISWLGQVPEHWEIKRLRFATEKIEQGWSPQCDNQPAEDEAWGVMKVGCVNGDQFDPLENKALPLELTPLPEYELRPKDILVSRANTKELLGSAAIVPENVRSKLLLCDKLFRLRSVSGVDEEFLTCYLRTPIARYQYEREATGASGSMQNIGQGTLKNLAVPLPPLDEQKQIYRHITCETAKLDALTDRVGSAITRLTEYRTTLITAATTGKIDVRQIEIPAQA